MSRKLYEDALADVKQLQAVAEDRAKRAVIEAVTPRIKQLIERELLSEDMGLDDDLMFDEEQPAATAGTTLPPNEVPVAAMPGDGSGAAAAVSTPDDEGKVTLDLDALVACEPGTAVPAPLFGEPVPVPEPEYELGLESLKALTPIVNSGKKFSQALQKISEMIRNLKAVRPTLRESKGYNKQIARTISQVENMYEYVQERISDPARKKALENKLETYFRDLTKLQELKMSNTLKDLIKEDDDLDLGGEDSADLGDADDAAAGSPGELTLKLTGLPDDVDLDSVGVDLVAGDSDGDDDVDLGGEEGGDEGGDDLGDLDLGGGDEGHDETGDQMESLQLSDDTIVEIDENMLRREIARMKKLREEAGDNKVPSNAGNGVDADAMDDFGGGSEDGEPFLDGEVTTESEEMDEGDDVVDEAEEMDESDDVLPEVQNRRKADENGVSPNSDMQSTAFEGLQRRVKFEKRIQERAKARAASLKKEAAKSRGSKKAALVKEYAELAKRHNASVERTQKYTKRLAEAAKKLKESRSNSAAAKQSAEVATSLRKKLAEQSLLTTKLVYANKLLQNENLTKRQKAQAIDRLDVAKNSREAKLVYESLVRALGANKPLREGRDSRVLGSGSRVARPGSTPQNLNEGFETDRWATLAGITKRA